MKLSKPKPKLYKDTIKNIKKASAGHHDRRSKTIKELFKTLNDKKSYVSVSLTKSGKSTELNSKQILKEVMPKYERGKKLTKTLDKGTHTKIYYGSGLMKEASAKAIEAGIVKNEGKVYSGIRKTKKLNVPEEVLKKMSLAKEILKSRHNLIVDALNQKNNNKVIDKETREALRKIDKKIHLEHVVDEKVLKQVYFNLFKISNIDNLNSLNFRFYNDGRITIYNSSNKEKDVTRYFK